jgi:hypothetical protein
MPFDSIDAIKIRRKKPCHVRDEKKKYVLVIAVIYPVPQYDQQQIYRIECEHIHPRKEKTENISIWQGHINSLCV